MLVSLFGSFYDVEACLSLTTFLCLESMVLFFRSCIIEFASILGIGLYLAIEGWLRILVNVIVCAFFLYGECS